MITYKINKFGYKNITIGINIVYVLLDEFE